MPTIETTKPHAQETFSYLGYIGCLIVVVTLTTQLALSEASEAPGSNQTTTEMKLSEDQRSIQVADSRDARVTHPYLLL